MSSGNLQNMNPFTKYTALQDLSNLQNIYNNNINNGTKSFTNIDPLQHLPVIYNTPNPNKTSLPITVANNTIHIPNIFLSTNPILNTPDKVPKLQYDRCLAECRCWQDKYNQMYTKYLTAINSIQPNSSIQYNQMRDENRRLKQKIRDLEQRQKNIIIQAQNHLSNIVNRHKQNTLNELMLLMNRYRLETKTIKND